MPTRISCDFVCSKFCQRKRFYHEPSVSRSVPAWKRVFIYRRRREESDHVLEEKPWRGVSGIKHKFVSLCWGRCSVALSHTLFTVHSLKAEAAADVHSVSSTAELSLRIIFPLVSCNHLKSLTVSPLDVHRCTARPWGRRPLAPGRIFLHQGRGFNSHWRRSVLLLQWWRVQTAQYFCLLQ